MKNIRWDDYQNPALPNKHMLACTENSEPVEQREALMKGEYLYLLPVISRPEQPLAIKVQADVLSYVKECYLPLCASVAGGGEKHSSIVKPERDRSAATSDAEHPGDGRGI